MFNITLVSTLHSEYGKCNAEELFKIIESINPDIIFEELTHKLFDKFYVENIIPVEPPEVKAVKRYVRVNKIKNIPVDIGGSQNLITNEIENMFKTFSKYTAYSKIEDEQMRLSFEEGYKFLNSKRNEELFEKKKIVEESLIPFQINKERLFRIHKLFYEEQDKREHEIIKNICNHSQKVKYNQGLLLLGSGHRKRIFEKLKVCTHDGQVKLNWALYGN